MQITRNNIETAAGSDGTRTRDLRRDRPDRPLRAWPAGAGTCGKSKAFLALPWVLPGATGDLLRDLRGIDAFSAVSKRTRGRRQACRAPAGFTSSFAGNERGQAGSAYSSRAAIA
jgi:hypothetical protein